MPLSAHDVAAELRARLPGVGAKKLHKLLYYCQAHHVAATGSPLFAESVSAWDMGPVVGTLWYAERAGTPRPSPASLDEASLNTVGFVLSRYGKLSGRQLEILTHGEAPWRDADRERAPGESVRIELVAMRDFFVAERDAELADLVDPLDVLDWLSGADERLAPDRHVDDLTSIRRRLADAG